MKIVLKRRKHRKGIRPVRKGTLKVKLQELPTAIQVLMDMSAFSKYRDKQAPLFDALDYLNSGNISECNRIIITSKRLGRLYDFMSKGHDYLKEHCQIKPANLVLNVINDIDPVFGYPETMDEKCARCPINKGCSFKCYQEPEHRFRWCPMAADKRFMTPVAKELTTPEIAELALTHLS